MNNKYEALIKIYADLVKRGERTLESIKNTEIRNGVRALLTSEN